MSSSIVKPGGLVFDGPMVASVEALSRFVHVVLNEGVPFYLTDDTDPGALDSQQVVAKMIADGEVHDTDDARFTLALRHFVLNTTSGAVANVKFDPPEGSPGPIPEGVLKGVLTVMFHIGETMTRAAEAMWGDTEGVLAGMALGDELKEMNQEANRLAEANPGYEKRRRR